MNLLKGGIHSIRSKHTGGAQVAVEDRELFSDLKQSNYHNKWGLEFKEAVGAYSVVGRKRHLLIKNETHYLRY